MWTRKANLAKGLFVILALLGSLCLANYLTSAEPLDPPALYHKNLGPLLTNAIKQAKTSVHLTIFSLNDPHILAELAHARKRGCEVIVICDRGQSCPFPGAIRRKAKGLMHRKILIIDKELVWIGSANMTYSSLHIYNNLFLLLGSKELAEALQEGKGVNPLLFEGGEFWLTPDLQALDRLCTLIEEAKTSLQIAMFTWTSPKLLAKVIQAHRRGVHVQVAIDRSSSRGASSSVVAQLQASGIEVVLGSQNHLLHHKHVLIDQKILAMGSANWTESAFAKNEDCLLILHSLNEQQHKTLKSAWKQIA
ncbi:MAG: hypothetical protein JSR80_00830 [Verrucomicrobia bacterium]|nr:hypothetical protein [Verrucomicrobiota bacterium]